MPAVELPTETLPDTPLPNPVILPDMEVSKGIFNDAMAAEKNRPAEETLSETPSKEPEPPSKPEETPSKVTDPESQTSDKVDVPTEISPAAKANLPEELLTGKKPEPKVDDVIAEIDAMVLPKNAKPEQVASFSKLKEQSKKVIEEKLARISELESKTSDSTSRAEIEAASERIKAAEAKAKEYEQTIERIAFTESPKFKQMLNDEVATLTAAKAYFEGTGINPDIIEYAARLNGAKRIQVLTEAGADPNIIAAVSPYLAQFDTIQRHKTGELENWKVGQAQYAEQAKAQQEAQLQQRRKAEDDVWSQTVHELSDLVPLRKFEKNDSWNSRADELLQKAKQVYNGDGVDLKEVATKLLKGEAYDALDEVRIAITEELNKVLKENARLKSAKPGASNGQVPSNSSNDKNLTPIQQATSRFNQEMAKARG